MIEEPINKRAVAFFDGQNLYHHAKDAFGYTHPNFDPLKLFDAVCKERLLVNKGIRFYTGVHSITRDEFWHKYWSNRVLAMKRAGIEVITRDLRYRDTEIQLEDGSIATVPTSQEKGIDIRIALDIVRMVRAKELDVAVVFSQDQDLAEVAQEIREIAKEQQRWVRIDCAFPTSRTASASRGIDKTDWFKMDKSFYDACLDERDYRPKTVETKLIQIKRKTS
ncbi:MAG: NYN domain-containing protein [Rickettsiales bacterium]|nr:NYN domain-containing protein [Rickettsiales bacterium]